MRSNPASANLSDRLVASVSQAAGARTTPGLYQALLRLLANGEPVTIATLAAAAGYPLDEVHRAVAGWNDTEYDQQGRIIGWALTCVPRRTGSTSTASNCIHGARWTLCSSLP